VRCKKCGGTDISEYIRNYKGGTRKVFKCKSCESQAKPEPTEEDYIDAFEQTIGSSLDEEIEPIEKEGKLEYTNKHEITENGYKIYYADTYITATHEELRKALMKYCVGNLTMNQVAMAMSWTRQEFNAIKTAFHITKDSAPFTPFEIDELSVDQMAEIVRIEKKRYALEKIAARSNEDIRKEIDRHHKADYFLEQICERVNKIDISPFTINPQLREEFNTTRIIKITDEHAGLTVGSLYNTYNLEIMKKRFQTVTEWVVNNLPVGHVIIESGGDIVHGLIHGSTEKASSYVLDSLEAVIGCYIKLFNTLRTKGYSITFAKANGSHASLEKNKMNRTEEENLGRILSFTLQQVFADDIYTHILPKIIGTNHTIVDIGNNHSILLGHGDEMSGAKSFAAYAKLVSEKVGRIIGEVHLGHIHHEKAEYMDGVYVEHSLSFCGTDQYASKLGLISPCGFTSLTYKNGARLTKQIIEF